MNKEYNNDGSSGDNGRGDNHTLSAMDRKVKALLVASILNTDAIYLPDMTSDY